LQGAQQQVDALRPLHRPQAAEPKPGVLAYRQMGKEGVRLRHVAQPAPLRGHVYPAGGVEQGLAVERDPALHGVMDAGDAAQEQALAPTRWPKKHQRLPGRDAQRCPQLERLAAGTCLCGEVNVEHGLHQRVIQ